MSPDLQSQLLGAIRHGPANLPPDLLEGQRAAQYRALKAYANTINHARHVALEETFPRTRYHMGDETFHAAAIRYLEGDATHRPLRHIGQNFPNLLGTPQARDIARVEWGWLEAHGAADAPALLLERLKGVTPEGLLAAKVRAHPAARMIALEEPRKSWPDVEGQGTHILITRPEASVIMARATRHEAALLTLATRPVDFGLLLERHADAGTTLVKTGALRPLLEIVP